MRENEHTADHSLNWKRATMLIWEADDSELQLIIDLVTEWERQHGTIVTPADLRRILQRPGL
jgi:hypothetical protein